ncbi:MAG: MSHA biogenesis protein MshQ [Phenylobacterium sp.]|jgi:MSHA biogenesis protein MshQ
MPYGQKLRSANQYLDKPSQSAQEIKMPTKLLNAFCLTVLLLWCLLWSKPLWAGQCSATFSDGITSAATDGTVLFAQGSSIGGNPDGILAAVNVDSSLSTASCWPIICTSGGTPSEPIDLTPFSFSANDTLTISQNNQVTIGDNGDYLYYHLKMKQSVQLTFTSQPLYAITTFKIAKNGIIKMPAGDYYIDTMTMAKDSRIDIIGSGTVRLYIKNSVSFGSGARINATADPSGAGQPSQLFIYAYNDFTLAHDATVNGYIYAQNNLKLNHGAIVTGSVSATHVELQLDSRVNYDGDDIANADFGGSCSNGDDPTPVTTLVAEYRFDQCLMDTGIVDNIGSYPATPTGLNNSSGNAVVGQSLDLSPTGTADWVSVPPGTIHGLDDFTISIWVNTSVTKDQQEIFHALGSGTSDDELELALSDDDEVYLKMFDDSDRFDSSINLTDGQWHQITITRSGNNACLYVDGQYQECKSGYGSSSLSVTNSAAFVMGQEQDGYGSSFESHQAFDGLLDEFRIYSGVVSSSNITSAYDNEKAGLNYDGTSRTPVSCTISPIAEYQFDETSYSGASGEVVDSIGGFNGYATLTQPVAGKVCNAADFSTSGIEDYITLDKDVLDGRKTFSLSLWTKSHDYDDSSLIAGANNSDDNEFIMWFESNTDFEAWLHNNAQASITTTSSADNSWHHLVWTRSASQHCFYRDKVLQGCVNYTADTLNLDNLLLGQEQDSVGGNFDSSQAFDGLIDELVIFDDAIGLTQISSIYDNQNSGLGYDGSARTCPPAPPIQSILDMRFDESDWNNTNDVLDSSGNNYHGSAINSTPVSGLVCNAADLSANGTSDYLTVNASAMNGLSDFTVVVWGKTTQTSDSTILSAANGDSNLEANEAIMYFEGDRFWPHITASGFYTNTRFSSTPSFNDGDWHQHAWTREASSRQSCYYFDGISQGCVTHTDGDDSSPLIVTGLVLGQEQDSLLGGFSSAQDWEGLIDELLIVGEILSETEINTMRSNVLAGNHWDGTAGNCDAPIHHYEITHTGHGLTCASQNVSFKACLNADCSNLSTDPITFDFNVDGNFIASTTIIESGSIDFNYTTAGEFTLSISNASKAATSAQECNLNGVNNCVMNFASAGFLVDLVPGEACLNHDDGLIIQAVKQSETSTTCAPAFTGNQTVNLSFNYSAPADGTKIPSVEGSILAAEGVNQQRTLSFNSVAKAELDFAYADAGAIQISVSANGIGPLAGLTLTGSDTAIFYPNRLAIQAKSGSTVLDNATSGGIPIHVAGSTFDIDITAQCDSGDTTPNYQPQSNDRIEFAATRTAPDTVSGGQDGGLLINGQTVVLGAGFSNIALAPSSFTAGTTTVSSTYSEVGLIQLDAQDNQYHDGLAPHVIAAANINVGRFVPANFVLESEVTPTFTGHCAAFVYTGGYVDPADPTTGSIGYQATPSFKITPYNATGQITKNYVGLYNKLTVGGVSRTFPANDTNQNGVDNLTKMPLDTNMTDGSLSVMSEKWVSLYTYNMDDNFTYIRNANALIAPFDATLEFIVTGVTDADSISSNAPLSQTGTGMNVRYGRWYLAPTFGPEANALAIPMQLEYFDGTNFVINTDDSCTTFDAANVTLETITLDKDLTAATGVGTFVSGETTTNRLWLAAPGSPNKGQVRITYDVPDWLGFDWNGINVLTSDPTTIATFGQYRGNDRVIYWREVQ